MAQYALIDRGTGEVVRVIIADAAFVAADPFVARGKRVSDYDVVRVATSSTKDPDAEVITRTCGPLSGWDPVLRVFVRPAPSGQRWDKTTRTMINDPTRAVPLTTEERLAALESSGGR